MNIFKRISISFKVSNKFRPYFRYRERSLTLLEHVDNDIDEDIKEIYELMQLVPNKYKKDKAKYEAYVDKINLHNDEVKYITEVVESWNLDDILDNPYRYDEGYFVKCAGVASLLNNYRELSPIFLKFKKEVERVKDDYKKICLEYDTFAKYNALFDFSSYTYITHEIRRKIDGKCTEALATIDGEPEYYSFEKHLKLDELINEHNDEYLDGQIDLPLFDNINGHSLDKEQRKAVLIDEKSVLVVAGAGSGKTLTICGKVEYLLKVKKIKPEEILLLSYSKKSADDLQTKISRIDDKLTVGTFHKIGLDILKDVEHKTFMVEDQYKAIIEAYFREEIKNRPHMLQTILLYYSLYISSCKHGKKYKNDGELFEDLKKSDFDTLKNQLLSLTNDINARETIKKELVKSFEEMAIANWYFINGIDYMYEAPYEHDVSTLDKRQYMPDFKLKDYPIYHEHYGIDKNGKASQYEAKEAIEYVQGMEWKRRLHQEKQTDCIETYSYEFEDGTIFEKLEKELKKRGVEFRPLSNEEIINALSSIYESRSFKSFINLIRTFLCLYKSSYQDDSMFETLRNSGFSTGYERRRTSMFIDIVKDLYHYYYDYLSKEGKIDFDDMILSYIDALDHTKGCQYKYIIVELVE